MISGRWAGSSYSFLKASRLMRGGASAEVGGASAELTVSCLFGSTAPLGAVVGTAATLFDPLPPLLLVAMTTSSNKMITPPIAPPMINGKRSLERGGGPRR